MNRRSFLYSTVGLSLSPFFPFVRADDSTLPSYVDHIDPGYWIDPQGRPHKVQSIRDWEKRKRHVLAYMQTVMGPVPEQLRAIPLDLKALEQKKLGPVIRRKVSYQTDSKQRRVRAWLFVPSVSKERRPAVLCLHQTTRIGKDEPAGLGGKPNLHYAIELAQRGYVTLAPDYPSFGEYPYEFPKQDGYISGTMKAIVDNMRAVDLLQSLPEVDPDRIGCTGHSLGGHNTMFTAAFDARIKAIVSNCGFTRFHKYYGGKLKGWTSKRYMPLINDRYENDPDQVPFDFPEIIASFAPRPFLASSPVRDGNFEVSGVQDSIKAARPIYQLYGAAENLVANYPDCAHDWPVEAREFAWKFLDKHLKR